MKSSIRKMGNSQGVIIPKLLLEEIGAKAGDPVDMQIENGKVVIMPLVRDPRSRWAEECKALAAAGEDRLVWPEFGNRDDEDWEWK